MITGVRRAGESVVLDLITKLAGLISVEVPKVVLRRMKTNRDTCTAGSHTILLNPGLEKKDPGALST